MFRPFWRNQRRLGSAAVQRYLFSSRRVIVPSSITDRKSTRLNSSHSQISYAVFCLKKKKNVHCVESHHRRVRTHTHAIGVHRPGVVRHRSTPTSYSGGQTSPPSRDPRKLWSRADWT